MTLELKYPTKHLNGYGDYVGATRVLRPQYAPLHKLHWYQTNGLVLKKNKINLGDVCEDTRIQSLVPLASGKCKGNYKTLTRNICNKLGMKCATPSSLHPEQLIGKVLKIKDGKKWTFVENYGYLYGDCIQFDESFRLLNDQDPLICEIRNYLKEGLDSPPNNFVYKKLTEHTADNAISFNCECVAEFYFQPFSNIDETIVLDGFLRRFHFPLIEFEKRNTEKILEARKDYETRLRGTNSQFYLDRTIKNLKEIKSRSFDWSFSEDALTSVADYASTLVSYSYERGGKASNWADIMEFSFTNQLVKYAAIIAGSHLTDKIDRVHVQLAFMDYFEDYVHSLDFLEKKVMGNFDYGALWRGAYGKNKQCLSWLYEQGGVSEDESKISVADFVRYVVGVFKCSERGASRKLDDFAKKGWIGKKQTGQYESKIWLAFKPEIDKEITLVSQPLDVYYKLTEDYEKLLSRLLNKDSKIIDSDLRDDRNDRNDTGVLKSTSEESENKPPYGKPVNPVNPEPPKQDPESALECEKMPLSGYYSNVWEMSRKENPLALEELIKMHMNTTSAPGNPETARKEAEAEIKNWCSKKGNGPHAKDLKNGTIEILPNFRGFMGDSE